MRGMTATNIGKAENIDELSRLAKDGDMGRRARERERMENKLIEGRGGRKGEGRKGVREREKERTYMEHTPTDD